MTAVAVVLACAALAFAYAAWERAGVTARAMYDHGQALQDVRAEIVSQDARIARCMVEDETGEALLRRERP